MADNRLIHEDDIEVMVSSYSSFSSDFPDDKASAMLSTGVLDRRETYDRRTLIRKGEALQGRRYRDSGYGDLELLTAPHSLEIQKEISPIGYIHAVGKGDQNQEVLATMMIYNGHNSVPRENDFYAEISKLRAERRHEQIMSFGSLAIHEQYLTSKVMFVLIMRKAVISFLESDASAGFLVVHPQHEGLYSRLGYKRKGFVACVEGLKNAPGVYMEVVKGKEINAQEVNRVIWGNKYKDFTV